MSISILTGSSSASIFAPRLRNPVAVRRSYSDIRIIGRQKVARELLLEELVVWLVLVECRDDIVAIPTCVPVDQVLIEPVGISVSSDVQPVPSPTFSVSRGGQQSIDDTTECVRVVICEKRLHFLRSRR